MKLAILFLFLLTSAVAVPHSRAASRDEQAQLDEALSQFQKGAYQQSIETAGKIQTQDQEVQALVALFTATAYAKLQAYDKAIPFFAKAEKLKSTAPSLQYDYGQALLAAHDLKEAEVHFKKSILKRFKIAASGYYIAYIRQIQEDRTGAKDFYNRIQRLGQDPDRVKQPALYQIAEIDADFYGKEDRRDRRIKLMETKVLPQFEKARDYAPETPTGIQADQKVKAIEAEAATLIDRMINGNPIPRQLWSVRVTQDLVYDTNVITEADGALIQVSEKDSLISKTGFTSKYQWNWRSRWSFIPELAGSFNYHSRRKTPRVYQNDNISLTPAFRVRWEHWSRRKPATGLLDIEYNYLWKDFEAKHEFPYYSRYLNITVGERLRWFDTGTTTLKAGIKFSESSNQEYNSYQPSVSLQQNVKIFEKYDLNNTFTADYLHARNDANDERNFKLRHSVTFSNFVNDWSLNPSLTLTYKDTMKQKGTRGNELLLNSTVGMNRNFASKLEGSGEYGYTHNFSKAADTYRYSKHEFKVGVAYNF